ncbi:hypothetical protein Nans01_28030 [Nocardiopsis ansamitocini]|uniref:N-acetyltransferase domain-containing protein n=1 Tax=Nocardiopsis ansamitocini TaxID=1670832 RepID=A0A9W6UJ77_9ACTN|nr:hypothetical protein Nans01_28030 [Nocardiopsis ansamitocini]
MHTEHLLLRPYTPADEEAFVAVLGDPRVTRRMDQGPYSHEAVRALFQRVFTHVYPHNRFDVWAVLYQDHIIGHGEVKPGTDVPGTEPVHALAHSHWGRGLGSELARALCTHAFTPLGLDHIHATVAADNTASLHVLHRIGFVHARDIDEGTTRVLTRTR